MKLVEFFIVKHTIFIGIAKLEYSAERFFASWLERLTSDEIQFVARVG